MPCIILHLINNTLGVVHGRFAEKISDAPWLGALVALDNDGGLRYRWPTLVVCLAVAAPLLVWLFRPLFASEPGLPGDSLPGDLNPPSEAAKRLTAGNVLVGHRE